MRPKKSSAAAAGSSAAECLDTPKEDSTTIDNGGNDDDTINDATNMINEDSGLGSISSQFDANLMNDRQVSIKLITIS
jgi:hypothetical protein